MPSTVLPYSLIDNRIYFSSVNPPLTWSTCGFEKEEDKEMNKLIQEMYPKTDDAVLVDKYFSNDMPCESNFLNKLILGKFKIEILEEAKRLESKSK